RIARVHACVHPVRAAGAEAPIAFLVAVAEVDRVEVVPKAQEVRRAGTCDEGADRGVGVRGGRLDAAVRGFLDLDREEQVFAVAAPAELAAAAALDAARAAPDL